MSNSLDAILKTYEEKLERVAQRSCADLSQAVIARTPVDKGDLRASWNASLGGPTARNVSGGGGSNAASVANSLKIGGTFSLCNGQPYARRIEYEGYSAQAPAGMLRISVAEWGSIVRSAAGGK